MVDSTETVRSGTLPELDGHLAFRISDRGLHYMPEVLGTHPGTAVEAHTSSAADGPHIWLTFRWDQREYGVHLSAESAWQLKEQIAYLVMNHYQGDSRPDAG